MFCLLCFILSPEPAKAAEINILGDKNASLRPKTRLKFGLSFDITDGGFGPISVPPSRPSIFVPGIFYVGAWTVGLPLL